MSIEERVRAIAEEMGMGYLFASWRISDAMISELVRTKEAQFPMCLNIMPFEGQFVLQSGLMHDAPNCTICFCDHIPFDFTPSKEQPKVERLKKYAKEFVARVNRDNWFNPISGSINYNITYDRLDANLVIVAIYVRLEEATGICEDTLIERSCR